MYMYTLYVQCRLDDITYGSFVAHIGYKHIVSASDMVMCVTALLEGGEVSYVCVCV